MISLTINDKKISVPEGTTVLQAAEQLGIEIPTLCYLQGYPAHTSCMICVVKDLTSGKLIPSCSSRADDGMAIQTQDEEILSFRKSTLDLLLSEHVGDCRAPCQRICPALMDIPAMIRAIQQGDWPLAIRIVKEDIPLPAVLGRICSAPCENGCTRKQHDEPVSICLLKRAVADIDLTSAKPFRPECAPSSGKHIVVIGAGPGGLSAAYYLAQYGHQVILCDDHEKPGGALRYAVPEDKLDRSVLDAEIERIVDLGITLEMNTRLGEQISLASLQKEFDAIVIMTGDFQEELSNDEIETTKRGIKVDRRTFMTNINGVFAGGNVVSSSKMAVRAVGHGKTIAMAADQYVREKPVVGRISRFNSILGRLYDGESREYLKEASSIEREEPSHLSKGFSADEAIKESERCFRCDCRKQNSCKLRLYSDIYDAAQSRYRIGKRGPFERHVQHDLVVFEPGKCIKCGICIQITERAGEQFGFTFIRRGFNVKISIPFDEALKRGLEKVAEECAAACPTAAISLKSHESQFAKER